MELTAFGLVLMVPSLIFLMRPSGLLQLTLLAGAFGAAAPLILHFGGEPFGLQSGFLPGALFMGVMALDYLTRTFQEGERQAARAVLPMVVFTLFALAGAVILPRLFAGRFEVWPQRVGPLLLPVVLEPNSGNVTQSLYLAANTAMLVFAALYVSRPGTRVLPFLRVYLASGYVAVAFAFWQFAHNLTGLYYPSSFLYSNPRWGILTGQAFGDVHRINGSFTEPASLAGFLSGIVCACLWLLFRGHGTMRVRVLLLLSLIALWLSTSTTGIVVLVVLVPIVLARLANSRQRQSLGLGLAATLGAALALYVVAYLALPGVAARMEAAVDTVAQATIDKPESASYDIRTTIDSDSLSVLVPSFGLGAGWGSLRSSSLIPGVLGATGVIGFALLAWFALCTRRLAAEARRLAPSGEARITLEAMAGSILGTLAAALLAGPTINDMDFFVRLAVLIGCAVRIRLDARAPYITTEQQLALAEAMPAPSMRASP